MKTSTVKTRPTSGKTINIRTSSSKYFWRIWRFFIFL
jgi:hypothetical protein